MNKDVEIPFNGQAIHTKNPGCLGGNVGERRWRIDWEGVRNVVGTLGRNLGSMVVTIQDWGAEGPVSGWREAGGVGLAPSGGLWNQSLTPSRFADPQQARHWSVRTLFSEGPGDQHSKLGQF